MKVDFTQRGSLQIGYADAVVVNHNHDEGETGVDLPDDVARLFIEQGVARPSNVAPERATAPAGETADKPRTGGGRSRGSSAGRSRK